MNCEGKSTAVMNTKKLVTKSNSGRPVMFDFHKKNFPFQNHFSKYLKNYNTENSGKKCFLKPFFYSKGLSKNLKIHFLYECTFCQKLFAHNSNLNRHMMVHSDEKLFQCNLCEKFFTSSSNLGTHLGNHSGTQMTKSPFKCGYCKKIFTKSNELIKHIELHTKQNANQQKTNCSLKADSLSEGFKSCLGTKYIGEQSMSAKDNCSFDQHYKPDHTYCFNTNQELNDGNKTNLLPFADNSKCSSSTIEKSQLQPDHTYWSHAKKSRFCKRKVKSSHFSKEPPLNQSGFKKPNIESDHTYSSGSCSDILWDKLHLEPLTCNNAVVPEKNVRKLKPDHTYSIGVHDNQNTNTQEDSYLQDIHHSHTDSHGSNSRKTASLNTQHNQSHTDCNGSNSRKTAPLNTHCNQSHTDSNGSNFRKTTPLNTQHNQSHTDSNSSNSRKTIPLNTQQNQNCQQVNTPLKKSSKNNCIDQPVETAIHCSNVSKPDHTYSHKKVISNMNNLKTFGSRSVKTDWDKFTLQAAKENQPSFDHTYCSDAKLQKEPDGKGTADHTYCLEEDDFICSHNWNANMMLDHTYCMMHAVTRHF